MSEHAFDKLRLLDCTFAEFDAALAAAEVIEERQLGPAELKELVLVIDWVRPLHVVVVVDDEHEEERRILFVSRGFRGGCFGRAVGPVA